jgi:hypothetical protein
MLVFLAAGQVKIGVNNHDDCGTYSQEGLRSWSESSHTEPLSMTVSHYFHDYGQQRVSVWEFLSLFSSMALLVSPLIHLLFFFSVLSFSFLFLSSSSSLP